MNKNMIYKLREDKQDEFIENYEYQSYKYANRDDCYYLKISKHLILDQDTLEILSPTNKLEEEDIDLLTKLEANDMLFFCKKGEIRIMDFKNERLMMSEEEARSRAKELLNENQLDLITKYMFLEQQCQKQKEVIDKAIEELKKD